MGRNIKFVSSKRIISKLIRDTGFTDISETDMIEWIGEALGGINTTGIKDTKVMFANIENYQGKLPSNVEEILQVLRSNEDYRYSAMEVSAGCKVEEFDKDSTELIEILPCGCGTEPIPSKELPTWTHDFEVLDTYMQLKGSLAYFLLYIYILYTKFCATNYSHCLIKVQKVLLRFSFLLFSLSLTILTP